MYSYHMQLPYTVTIYSYNIQLPYTVTINSYHIQLQKQYQIQLQYTVTQQLFKSKPLTNTDYFTTLNVFEITYIFSFEP